VRVNSTPGTAIAVGTIRGATRRAAGRRVGARWSVRVKLTLFTPDAANQAIKELEPQIRRLVGLRREYARVESRQGVLAVALAGASDTNPDAVEARDLERRRESIALHIRRGLEAVHALGVVVKDLDVGLVDFYSLMGDRLVFLCWKLGEREVAHWHPLAGGFSTRQPLDRSPLEE